MWEPYFKAKEIILRNIVHVFSLQYDLQFYLMFLF
jgi:hypothetical protein